MKSTPAQRADGLADAPSPATTKVPLNSATVYTFVIWDHDKGATAIYPHMATLEAIAKMRGKVNEDTAWIVDQSELDIEGFYPPRKPRNR